MEFYYGFLQELVIFYYVFFLFFFFPVFYVVSKKKREVSNNWKEKPIYSMNLMEIAYREYKKILNEVPKYVVKREDRDTNQILNKLFINFIISLVTLIISYLIFGNETTSFGISEIFAIIAMSYFLIMSLTNKSLSLVYTNSLVFQIDSIFFSENYFAYNQKHINKTIQEKTYLDKRFDYSFLEEVNLEIDKIRLKVNGEKDVVLKLKDEEEFKTINNFLKNKISQ